MRKVKRFIDSVGYHEATTGCRVRYRLKNERTGAWGSWIGGSTAQRFANVALTRPTQSGEVVLGWRMPTGWAVLAGRTHYDDFDYECIRASTGARYNFSGHGSDPAHGLPTKGGVTVVNGNMTVLIDGMLEQRARSNARNKIQDLKIDIGTALAESIKTVEHLATTVERLYSLIHAVRSYDWRSATRIANNVRKTSNWSWANAKLAAKTKRFSRYQGRKLPGRVGNGWLEYQYGWLPLISDIYGLQELLKSKIQADDLIFQVSSAASDEFAASWFHTEPLPDTQYMLSGEGFEQFVKVVYNLKVNSSRLRAAGMGVTNPLAVAWELVPFSFVIDWLYPIGSFLTGLSAPQGTAFVSGFEDRIISGELVYTATRYEGVAGEPVTWTYEQFAFERRVKAGVDFTLPYIRSPFSTVRVASAIALTYQLKR